MANLNAKHLLVRNKTTGVDFRVDAILDNVQPLADVYQKALKVLNSPIKKGYFEACLVASTDIQKIAEVLEVDPDVVTLYRDFFYDVSGMDKLDLLDLIHNEDDASNRNMKLWAMSQGLDFISWRLGKFVAVNPVEGLREMFTLCTYKTKEAMFSANASDSSKEATKWAKLSMDLARLLKAWVMDSDSARRDIEIALASIEPTFEGYGEFEELPKPQGEVALSLSEANLLAAEALPPIDKIQGLDSLDVEFQGFPE